MRRRLDLYDYLLWATALLMLTLTVPVLPGRLMSGDRVIAGVSGFFLGLAALRTAWFRRRPLRDNRTDGVDTSDCVLTICGLFFAREMTRSYFRWSASGMTLHRAAILWVLGFLSIFAFYCIIDRGGWRKFAIICFFLGYISLLMGFWRLASGSDSPRFYYVYASKESAYEFLMVATFFLLSGVLARIVQKRRENQG